MLHIHVLQAVLCLLASYSFLNIRISYLAYRLCVCYAAILIDAAIIPLQPVLSLLISTNGYISAAITVNLVIHVLQAVLCL